jgi:hypothetical protein
VSGLPPQSPGTRTLTEAMRAPDDSPWNGPKIRYDLVKEFVIALVVLAVLAVALAVVFSSPDDHPVTIKEWAQADPGDFLTTAVAELDGSSPTATDFVVKPLQVAAASDPALQAALDRYAAASADQQQRWTTAYTNGVAHATFQNGAVVLPPGRYGPVEPMLTGLLGLARTSSLDAELLASTQFYGTDYTKPLLFLADGSYMASKAGAQHLQGTQWGMMNETGNYPGQAWLWLYTMWYQVPPFTHTGNADALVWTVMMVLTLLLLLLPLIPGLRSIPRLVPVYRLIWRDHYRRLAQESGSG